MPLPALLAPLLFSALGGLVSGGISKLFGGGSGSQSRGGFGGRSGSQPGGLGGITEHIQRFTPEQQQALSQLLQTGLGGLGEGLDFGPIEEQARTQFEQRTVPSIAERFAGLDALGSSGFQQSLGQAGAGLESQLAAQKSQFGLQKQGLLQNLLGLGLQPQYETLYQPRQPGFLESVTPGLAGGLGQAIGSLPMLLSLLSGRAGGQ